MLVVSKFGNFLNLSSSNCESAENSTDIGTLLHRNNAELVLFVDPDKEGLLVVVEDASALWPVAVETTGFEESVSLLEEEVVSD